jgi:CRP/FNR family transcriptional regulator, cyclic AMP receptor protein
MITSLAQGKALIHRYIDANETDKAVTTLCRMAVACARKAKFPQAEAFRDLLYEVDSTALVAIMKVNEFIENEKRKRHKPNIRRLWPSFFKNLPGDEAEAFLLALQVLELTDDAMVLEQSHSNDRLYLINQGRLKVVFENRGREMLIRHLDKGQLFGEDTFFSVNVCTASVVTMSPVHLSYLDQPRFKRLLEKYPAFEGRLLEICRSRKSTYDYLRELNIDRRATRRIHLQSKVMVQLLTGESQRPMQRTLSADLWDVSKNGLCFYISSKNREAVRRLIGRTLGVRIKLNVEDKPRLAAVTGEVQGVQQHPLNQYSVHMKLNPPFSDKAMAIIRQISAK